MGYSKLDKEEKWGFAPSACITDSRHCPSWPPWLSIQLQFWAFEYDYEKWPDIVLQRVCRLIKHHHDSCRDMFVKQIYLRYYYILWFPCRNPNRNKCTQFLYKSVSMQTYIGLIPVPFTLVISNTAHFKCWHSQEPDEEFLYRLNGSRKDRDVGCVEKGVISIQQASHLLLKSSLYCAQGVRWKECRRQLYICFSRNAWLS